MVLQKALSGPPFRPKHRADTLDSTEQQQHFKLRLPRIKQIVELHGGEMHITSRPGVGTTVNLTLPVYDATLHRASTEWQRDQQGGDSEQGSNRRCDFS
jgi:signal transduction histidine kinase